jgi:hypothetical protein
MATLSVSTHSVIFSGKERQALKKENYVPGKGLRESYSPLRSITPCLIRVDRAFSNQSLSHKNLKPSLELSASQDTLAFKPLQGKVKRTALALFGGGILNLAATVIQLVYFNLSTEQRETNGFIGVGIWALITLISAVTDCYKSEKEDLVLVRQDSWE